MAQTASGLEIIKLWSSVFLEIDLSGYESPTQRLIALAEARSEDGVFTIDDPGVQCMDNPAVGWLHDAIDETVDAYFRASAMDYPIRWSLQSWPNINRRGDYHPPHNHAWCYLSGTYYVKMAGDGSGAISFYDPRATVNMLTPAGPSGSDCEYTLRPGPGTLLLWHSSLNHLVHPNLSDETRISISFNIVLEWANHYASDA